jgi:hypothetical protein
MTHNTKIVVLIVEADFVRTRMENMDIELSCLWHIPSLQMYVVI